MQQSDEVKPSELESASLISPHRRQKTILLNQKLPTSKTWEIFGDQKSTDYLWSATNIVEYKNDCRNFHSHLALIARGFSNDKYKNIFNATLPQFLEDDKEYNQKTACRSFEDEYDWMTDKFIKRIYSYTKLWIAFSGSSNYKVKYLYAK